ncbi:hypothetical protein DFP72DRAFT_512588 [Ephemerocybe angulata]|uniref:F-box domain-containing protein n=1 Tax=Ephemerocybe angulata TaxID=980116 RepID=A0A8H6M0Y0_9AGAR|nr:hypothetical protein DFP72DRAFT_512588 [Tulosesus angulatus]
MKDYPQEILGHVFQYAHPEVDVFYGSHSEPSSTWTLAAVSRSWRRIVLGSKALWTRLLINPKNFEAGFSDVQVVFRVCLAMSRTGNLPFHVRIGWETLPKVPGWGVTPLGFCNTFSHVFGPIFANASRMVSFADDCGSGALWLLTFCEVPLPELRELRLDGTIADKWREDYCGLLDLDAPRLHTLTLRNFDRPAEEDEEDSDYEPTFLEHSQTLPWTQVTDLTLDNSAMRHGHRDYSDLKSWHPFDKFPNLTSLRLYTHPYDEPLWNVSDASSPPHVGEWIKTLSIRAQDTCLISLLESTLRAPRLTELKIHLLYNSELDDESEDSEYWGYEVVEPTIGHILGALRSCLNNLHSKSSLTVLALHGLGTIPILDLVADLPALHTLGVDHQLQDQRFLQRLTWPASSPEWPHTLPDLRSLTWKYDADMSLLEQDRIVRMIGSRLVQPGTSKPRLQHLRIVYEEVQREALFREGSGLVDLISSKGRALGASITVETVCVQRTPLDEPDEPDWDILAMYD